MLAAIALGSNLPSPFGSPADNLREALRRMTPLGVMTAVSRFYKTAPVGYVEQPDFVNAAALLETDLGPLQTLRALLAIEHSMGRDRASAPRKGPRIVDLDVLLYEDAGASLVWNDPELLLPHPAMHERLFVLQPLAEIAPDLVHPTKGQTVGQLYAKLAFGT